MNGLRARPNFAPSSGSCKRDIAPVFCIIIRIWSFRVMSDHFIGIFIVTILCSIFHGLDSESTCRICLANQGNGQLLQPCQCSGTQASVHYHCLKEWIQLSKRLSCEVCQSNYTGIGIVSRNGTIIEWLRASSKFDRKLMLLASMMSLYSITYATVAGFLIYYWNSLPNAVKLVSSLVLVVGFNNFSEAIKYTPRVLSHLWHMRKKFKVLEINPLN